MSDSQPPIPDEQPSPVPPQQPGAPVQSGAPVPPPHPYAAAAQSSSGLSTAALVLGSLGLLLGLGAIVVLTAVGGFPAAAVSGLAILVGLAGLVLGIVALVRKQPKGFSLSGIITGALAMVLGISLFGACLVVGVSQTIIQGSGGSESSGGTEGNDGSGGASPSADASGPKGMQSGGVVFGKDLLPVGTPALGSGEPPVPSKVSRDGKTADVLLYVDFRCPVCRIFEETNAELLQQVVQSGAATLEVHPLTFLDKVSAGTQYSSRAAGAFACTVEEDPKGAWPLYRSLLTAEVQPPENTAGLTDEQLIAQVERATGGASAPLKSCIADQRFVPFAQAMNQYTLSTHVPNAVDPQLQVAGTPFAVVNGVPFTGAPNDAAAFRAFLVQQGIALPAR